MSLENTQDNLGTESITKLLIKFSIPAIVGMVVNMLYNVIDRMYIGNIPNVGGLAITGVGITMPVTQIITAFGMLVGIGTCASISIAFGKRRKDEAEGYLGNGLTLILIISAIIAVFGNIFAEQILTLFGASENTLPYALAYIRPLFWGTICNLFAFGLNNSVRSDGNPKISMYTMMIGAGINIVLDPIFIFGLNLGIQGAAYATVISQFIAGCWVLYYFTKSKKSSIKLKTSTMKLSLPVVKGILMIGLSPFLMQMASSVVSVIANNALMTHGGDLAIGAMAIITSVCSTISSVIVQAFPEFAVSMFNKDPQLTDKTVAGMKLFLLSMPLIGIQMTASTFYQAVGKPKKAMIISLSRQVIFLIPAFLFLPRMFGLVGVWLAGPIADTLAVMVSGFIIFKEMISLKKLDAEMNEEEECYEEEISA